MTIAARRSFARATRLFETRWSRWRTRLRSLRASDRDPKASRLPVEPEGLVLRLEHEPLHVGDGGPSAFPQPSPVSLQRTEGDFEGRGDVLLVDCMAPAQVRVGDASESCAGPDVLLGRDPDGLVHEEAELRQEPRQPGILTWNGKHQGSV